MKVLSHEVFAKIKLLAVEIAATILFVAMVFVFLVKELWALFETLPFLKG